MGSNRRFGGGPLYRNFGTGCAPCIVLEQRRKFHTSSRVWQSLRQVPSEGDGYTCHKRYDAGGAR